MFHDSFYLKQLLKKLSEEVGLLLIYVYFFFQVPPDKDDDGSQLIQCYTRPFMTGYSICNSYCY